MEWYKETSCSSFFVVAADFLEQIPNKEWAKTKQDKAVTFGNYLEEVLEPFPVLITTEEREITKFLKKLWGQQNYSAKIIHSLDKQKAL